MRLPGEQQQHEEVHRQSPPAAARPREVGSEGVAAATVVEAPAQIACEGHVEEQELAGGSKQKEDEGHYEKVKRRHATGFQPVG